MYKKQQPNGKWKFFEKYQDKQDKWKQVSVTKNSDDREAQSQARTELELKIAEKLSEEKEAEEAPKTINECYAESRKIRQAELAESTYLSETYGLKDFIKKFGQREIISIEPKEMQEYLFSNKYSNTTRHTIALRIGHIFQYAYSMGFTHENIMNRIILPKQKNRLKVLPSGKKNFSLWMKCENF